MLTQTKAPINKLSDLFKTLSDQLGGQLTENFGEFIIDVNNSIGQGYIRGTQVLSHKLFIEFNLKMNNDITLDLIDMEYNPVHFFYCEKAQFMVNVASGSQQKPVQELQTAIINDKSNTVSISFKANEHVKANVISVCKPYVDNDFSKAVIRIHNRFAPQNGTSLYSYKGSYNVKVATILNQIQETHENELVRKLYLDGLVQMILAMEIEHHKEDMVNQNELIAKLSRKELTTIKELGDHIREHYDDQFTIEDLTNQTGIPAAKLQEGFKHLYGRTVTDYIKNVRLEVAEELLKTTDLTISEVVYSIGFSSRSYFSKIFREKYHCSPKSFQDSIKQRAMAVSA